MKEILDELRLKSREQGFVTFDEILEIADRFALDLKSVEIITGELLDEKIIVLEEQPAQNPIVETDASDYDRSQIDYDIIFDEVLSIAPQLSGYVRSVKNIPSPKPGEEHYLITSAQDGNPYATTRLIKMFLKVVVRIALSFHKRYGMPLEDTIQDGNAGLIIAIEKFENKPGRRFSSYAPWWIQQNIQRNSRGLWLNVYTPYHVKDELFKISKFVGPAVLQATRDSLTNFVSIDELAERTCIDRDKIQKYLFLFRDPYSVEDIPNYSTEAAWERCLEKDIASDNYMSSFLLSITNGELSNCLTERERHILQLRSGLPAMEPMTLQEIGDELGLSRERVRQILSQIKKKSGFKETIARLEGVQKTLLD